MRIIHGPYCVSYARFELPDIIFFGTGLYSRVVQSQRGVERVAGPILPYLQLLVGMQFVPCRSGALFFLQFVHLKNERPFAF